MKYLYALKEIRVVDGDTLDVVVDQGLNCYHRIDMRLAGVDAPELNDALQRSAGQAVKQAVDLWIRRHPIETLRCESIKWDKYGRIVGDLVAVSEGESVRERLTSYLLVGGYVRAYDGGQRQPWADADLDRIAAKTLCTSNVGGSS